MIGRARCMIRLAGQMFRAAQVRVEASESWSPHWQATVTLGPDAYNTLTPFFTDPRYKRPASAAVTIWAGRGDDAGTLAAWTAAAGGTPVSIADLTARMGGTGKLPPLTALAHPYNGTVADGAVLNVEGLVIDEVTYNEVARTVTLSLAGLELLLQDFIPLGMTIPGTPSEAWPKEYPLIPGANYEGYAQQIVTAAGLPGRVWPDPAASAPLDYTPVWDITQSAWSVVEQMLSDGGYILIRDERDRWALRYRNAGDASPRLINLAQAIGHRMTLQRRDWADALRMRLPDDTVYVWDNTGWKAGKVVDIAPEQSTFANGWPRYERNRRRGRSHEITLPLDLTLRPLDVVSIQSPSLGTEPARIVSVQWSLPESTTTITTREV